MLSWLTNGPRQGQHCSGEAPQTVSHQLLVVVVLAAASSLPHPHASLPFPAERASKARDNFMDHGSGQALLWSP